MTRRAAVLCLPLLLVACGDDGAASPDAGTCVDTYTPALPDGPWSDPLALPLPDDCVAGGLDSIVGRWFVRDPGSLFEFGYPLFERTCETGIRRQSWLEEDHDDSDGTSFHTWSDGTRLFYRSYYRFESPVFSYEYTTAFAACVRPDGTLGAVSAVYDTDRRETITPMIGTRLEPKDTGARGLERVGAVAGSNFGLQVAVEGDYAYVAGYFGLDVIDVSNPAEPTVVGHVNGSINDVKIVRVGDTVVAYASPTDSGRTSIIDVTDPTSPRRVGSIGEFSHSLFVTPGPSPRLYLATYTSTIPVYDVSNPLVPVRLGGIPVPGSAAGIHDIHIAGDRVYAMKTYDGVVAMEVTDDLGAPRLLGTHLTSYSHAGWEGTIGGRKVFIHGDEGLTGTTDGAAFLRVLDADPMSPTFMQELSRYRSRPEIGIHNIQLVGDRAYIAYYQDGVRVVDLSDVTNPREVAYYNTWQPDDSGDPFEGSVGISVVNGLIYVANLPGGLLILRETR